MTLSVDAALWEGVVDLLFEEDGRWTLVDFKTDDRPTASLDAYRRQVALYAAAVRRATACEVVPRIVSL